MKKKIMTILAAVFMAAFVAAGTIPFADLAATAEAGVGDSYTVSVAKGYLALRTAKAYDSSNEIGELYTGDTVQVLNMDDSTYWYVYSPKYKKSGYVNKNYLAGSTPSPSGTTYTVSVAKGYLALRTAKAYDSRNEIGELYTGDTFTATDTSDNTYWYGYSPKYNKYGYVNRNYLAGSTPAPSGTTYSVSVATGYLALRTAKAYDSSNEIGELYTGDTFTVTDTSDNTYWYGYSPKYGRYGYVNRNYLAGAGSSGSSGVSGSTYTVSVATGYLALRTAPAYDYSNEIGELYTGDTFTATDTSGSTYWYGYSPKYGRYGYVNRNYLAGAGSSGSSSSGGVSYTVSVATGYLALRTAPAYDYSNEIGELYSGDTFVATDRSGGQYWYGYAPKYNNRYGYVNKDYLY